METQHKALTWAGWGLTGLIVVMMTLSATAKMLNWPEAVKPMVDQFEYPKETVAIIGIVEICCVIIFLIPRTAVLGAVLLTGYLGGAIATHVRIHDNFLGPAIGGILVWLAIFLRDARVRALLPLRTQL